MSVLSGVLGRVRHAWLPDVSADQHHNQAHAHSQSDGSGALGVLTNEFKGWPVYVADAIDLDAKLLWWRKIGTPTGGVTACLLTGETAANQPGNGLSTSSTLYNRGLKCVAAASGDGLKQTWTFADEQRLKVGRPFSVLVALWIAQAGTTRTVTLKLVNSDATNVTVTKQVAAGWNTVAVENLTLAGTTVDLQITADGAVTFYVVPLGARIAATALELSSRPSRLVNVLANDVVNADPGGGNTFISLDLTANTSNLAFRALMSCAYRNQTSAAKLVAARRNGDTTALSDPQLVGSNQAVSASFEVTQFSVLLDDGQVLQYATSAVSTDNEQLILSVVGWEEYA